MLKKCAILGLAVLFVGSFALAWLFNETRTEQKQTNAVEVNSPLGPEEYLNKYGRWYTLSPEEQNQLVLELDKDRQSKTSEEIAAEQQARLKRDFDKLAAGERNSSDIADFLYGPGWEDEVEQYKRSKEQREIARTTAVVCLPIGGTILGSCLLWWALVFVIRNWRTFKERRRTSSDKPPSAPIVAELTDLDTYAPADDEGGQTTPFGQRETVPGWTSVSSSSGANSENDAESRSLVSSSRCEGAELETQTDADEGGVAVLVNEQDTREENGTETDEQDDLPEGTEKKRRFTPRPKVAVLGQELSCLREEINEAANAPDGKTSLAEQADTLQEQLAEFRQMAQSVKEATREQSSEPLGDTLKDLAQQVSAIREYAASQQNRVEKLQDGYDWNIIRTFCLRVIRCIDNIETRVEAKVAEDDGASDLEEVRDELLFALESSGVEQFVPEVNTEYRGQEKLAEAVKDKEACKNPDEAGKIAKVVRPGYRYMIDEESFKVVRTAQVKLFG